MGGGEPEGGRGFHSEVNADGSNKLGQQAEMGGLIWIFGSYLLIKMGTYLCAGCDERKFGVGACWRLCHGNLLLDR